MKKILTLVTLIVLSISLTSCFDGSEEVEVKELNGEESLASLSYISAGFLDSKVQATENLSAMRKVNENTDMVIDGEMEQVNIYMDRLKTFINNGTDDFSDIGDITSDREEYANKMEFGVSDETYKMYYNSDESTGEIVGIYIIGDVEYDITGLYTLLDNDGTDDANYEMELVAVNGTDEVKVVYNSSDTVTKYIIEENIDGALKSIELKITTSEGAYKVNVNEDGDVYTFKQSTEDENTNYKLEYDVDGVKGFVMILEKTDDAGELVYTYKIHENGKNKTVEKGKPRSVGKGKKQKVSNI